MSNRANKSKMSNTRSIVLSKYIHIADINMAKSMVNEVIFFIVSLKTKEINEQFKINETISAHVVEYHTKVALHYANIDQMVRMNIEMYCSRTYIIY